jgi:16S rRNA G527 N7-methylase RsmG
MYRYCACTESDTRKSTFLHETSKELTIKRSIVSAEDLERYVEESQYAYDALT